jgi:hypothetical protein
MKFRKNTELLYKMFAIKTEEFLEGKDSGKELKNLVLVILWEVSGHGRK